jgi:sugar phosphate isomerase/epimerase
MGLRIQERPDTMIAMKLAEALALRADASRRVDQLRSRVAGSARYQEGEPPAEDAAALLAEAGETLTELESLIRRINRTNAATTVGAGTLTDALARRDVLRLRHGVLTSAADAAAGGGQRGFRQLRSELKMIAALPVADLHTQADTVARELREVDTEIQRANWEVDLLD